MNITLPRAVIEQALEALENEHNSPRGYGYELSVYEARETAAAITALKAALEQPEQEPVAWMLKGGHGTEFNECIAEELKALTWKGKPMWVPLYTAPPQRKPLTNEQRDAIARQAAENDWHDYEIIDAVEAAHNIKE